MFSVKVMPNVSLKLNFSPNGPHSCFQDTEAVDTAGQYEHIYRAKNWKLNEFCLDADFCLKV